MLYVREVFLMRFTKSGFGIFWHRQTGACRKKPWIALRQHIEEHRYDMLRHGHAILTET